MVIEHSSIKQHTLVIFGATGDLANRKLFPSLYALYKKNRIPPIPIICVGRKPMSNSAFHQTLSIPKDKKFLRHLWYVDQDVSAPFTNVSTIIHAVNKKYKCRGNIIYYVALPPSLFPAVVKGLEQKGLHNGPGYTRIVFEKPFGSNLKTATSLNNQIKKVFDENEVYRVDHYLGKEVVQNILVLRFANSLLEHMWSHRYIDHVQITVSETEGIGWRGRFYDKAGAIRDVVQNHLLQLVALTAMEPPSSLNALDIQRQKIRVLESLKLDPESVVTGQYAAGKLDGKNTKAYRAEAHVTKNSRTQTFAALKTFVNTPRWKGVPFYLRTGKRLDSRVAEINIVLKDIVCNLFCKERIVHGPNVISMRIQPDAGIAVRVNNKKPGSHTQVLPITMEFCAPCEFGVQTPKAYETLLYEVMVGDHTLFTKWEGVKASWKFAEKVLQNVKRVKVPNYAPGSTGPLAAEKMIKKDKREWFILSRRNRT
jgi:glucose-6-phosphate 1-dehydrogenase